MLRAFGIAIALGACVSSGGTSVDAPAPPAETHALGMNDVSILVPLPAALGAPVLGAAPAFVPQDAYDELVLGFNDLANHDYAPYTFADFQLVAVRFDPCDGAAIRPCPVGTAGRLRLVFQPIYTIHDAISTMDIALHALYAIAPADLPAVVGELRALARIANTPLADPLEVSPPLVAHDAAYIARLDALLAAHARPEQLVRLTTIGQTSGETATNWAMRGLDRAGATNTLIEIPEIVDHQQHVRAVGGAVAPTPLADDPVGLARAIDTADFIRATPHDQLASFAALQDVQNPLKHDAADTQCAGCHIANHLSWLRMAYLGGKQPTDLAGAYTNPRHDLTVTSVADTDSRVIRIFGWNFSDPVIAQRVANDTAAVLDDIDARFP